jgi:putative ABC transport system substrate-binding protein
LIARGYVESLAKPGANITGVFLRQTELAEKQVELLTQALPGRQRLAVLWDYISADQFEPAERRAKLLRLDVHSHKMENPPYDLESDYKALAEAGADMLLVLTSQFFALQREQLVKLALAQRMPTMFVFKEQALAGGQMAYGADPAAMYRQGARFVGRILNGAKPNELPVEQPIAFELTVNLRTAKTLGIELPTHILLRADHVIE